MKRLLVSASMLLLLLACLFSPAMAAWDDLFEPPQITGPGGVSSPGPMVETLTPELKFQGVGAVTYVVLYEEDSVMTLTEELSQKRNPILVCRVSSSSLKLPERLLEAGHRYSWVVESTYAPGSKSECTKISSKLYFCTSKTAK